MSASISYNDVRKLLRFTKSTSFWKGLNITLFIAFSIWLSIIGSKLENYECWDLYLILILIVFFFVPVLIPLFEFKEESTNKSQNENANLGNNKNLEIGLTKRLALNINIWVIFPSFLYSITYCLSIAPKDDSIVQFFGEWIVNFSTTAISIISVLHVIFLCIMMGFISYFLTTTNDLDWGTNRKNRTILASFYLIIFFQIAFILTLSLALHDESLDNTSLYAKNFISFKNNKEELHEQNRKENNKSFTVPLYFKSYSAEIKTLPDSARLPDLVKDLYKYIRKDNSGRLTDEEKLEVDTLIWRINNVAINDLIVEIKKIMQDNKSIRIKIKVIGHSDSLDILKGMKYKSNYELSEARALQAQLYLNDLFYKKIIINGNKEDPPINCEWYIFPLATEGKFYFKTRGAIDQRTVEVVLEVINNHLTQSLSNNTFIKNELNLLDYFYFLIYTITTTGYGDIQPISPYSKFIVTLANIIEMIFLVLFFNILLPRDSEKGSTNET